MRMPSTTKERGPLILTRFVSALRSSRQKLGRVFEGLRGQLQPPSWRHPRWRRAWIAGGLALASLLLLQHLFLPLLLRPWVERYLEKRSGMRAEVGSLSLRVWGRVDLEKLELRGRQGGIVLQPLQLRLRFRPWMLPFGRSAALYAVESRGGRLTLDLDHPGFDASRRQIAQALARPESSSASRRARSYRIRDFDLVLRDGKGEVLVLRRLGLTRPEDPRQGLTLRLASLEALPRHRHSLLLRGLKMRWSKPDAAAGWMAESLRLATLQLPEDMPAAWSEGHARLRKLRLRLLPSTPPRRASAADPRGMLARVHPHFVGRIEALVHKQAAQTPALRARSQWTLLSHDPERLWLKAQVEAGPQGGVQVEANWNRVTMMGKGRLQFRALPLDLLLRSSPALAASFREGGSLSGDLKFASRDRVSLGIEGKVDWRGGQIESKRIAGQALGDLDLRGEMRATLSLAKRSIDVAYASLRLGEGAKLHIAGNAELGEGYYRTAWTVELPTSDCDKALHSIPAGLLGELQPFRWEGNLSGRLRFGLDSRLLDQTILQIDLKNQCRFVQVPGFAQLERFRGPFLHRVRESQGESFEMNTGPGSANWAPFEALSPFLLHAVLAHEDASFFQHKGFAPWAIRDALVRNLREGRYVQGASTISMQLAKNLFLHREKNLARKIQEVLLTWWLESAWNKRDLLELYLNIIEYGPALYGIRQASTHYFHKRPADLSPAESAFLACILPAPKRYHAQFQRGKLSASLANHMRRLLTHMHARGRIDARALEEGLGEIDNFRFAAGEGAGARGQGRAAPIASPGRPAPKAGEDAWEEIAN